MAVAIVLIWKHSFAPFLNGKSIEVENDAMVAQALSAAEIQEGNRLWETYVREHDLTPHRGEVAGIDPRTGGVAIGRSIEEIVSHRRQNGLTSPLLFKRIGATAFYRKGRHA